MTSILVWWLNSYTQITFADTLIFCDDNQKQIEFSTHILLINFPSIHCCTAWRKIPTCSTRQLSEIRCESLLNKLIHHLDEKQWMKFCLRYIYVIVRSNLRAVFSSHQKFRFLKVALLKHVSAQKKSQLIDPFWIAYRVMLWM